MDCKHIVITGGAGFVGSSLCLLFKQHYEQVQVTALDNLMRRGSELNLPRLRKAGVSFMHGDIRQPGDLADIPAFDLLIDCSAEPSVHAGAAGGPSTVIDINLNGTIHCMEAARKNDAALLFLSTSRVYPIDPIRHLSLEETDTRFEMASLQTVAGVSANGIAETFPLEGARSFYGTTKLAAEYFLHEYAYSYNMPVMINRCGVIAGPWQMGKIDQGVVTLWAARHLFGKPLKYIGFGGAGKQVRDILHVNDLFALIEKQCAGLHTWNGQIFNAGGGRPVSASLLELTEICRDVTGCEIPITAEPETSAVDIPVYITDNSKIIDAYGWKPEKSVHDIITDIVRWIQDHRDSLEGILS